MALHVATSNPLVAKKQRFQIGFDVLFANASSVSSSLLALLIASTGSLVQKYSGPDAVSVPMEVLIRYGDSQDKFDLLFQIFDMAPTTSWNETVTKIHEQLVKNPVSNKLAKFIPCLWVTAKPGEEIASKSVSQVKQQQTVLKQMMEQIIDDDDFSPLSQKNVHDQSETAVSLIHAVRAFEYWVRILLIHKKGLDNPMDWVLICYKLPLNIQEVTIRTSRESFSQESEFMAVFSPGIFSSSSSFSPLGYFQINDDVEAALPVTVLNVDLVFPSLNPTEKGDPRLRSSSHLQNMWVKMAQLSKDDIRTAAATSLNQLPWLTQQENIVMLDELSGIKKIEEFKHSCPLDSKERLTDIFASTVARHARRTAILSPSENINMPYSEFDAKSTQLAHALRNAGITGGNVAMMLPRSAMMYVAIMGILKSGAAYVPIDPEYPADRVAYIVSDSDSQILLTNSKLSIFFPTVVEHRAKMADSSSNTPEDLASLSNALRDVLPPYNGKVWLLDIIMNGSVSKLPTESFPCPATSSDLAYIIYTSGSTGRPKGVMLEHRNVCALVRAERHLYNSTPNDITWQGFSIAFDASVEELWLAWAAGGALFCASHEMIHAGPQLAEIWAEHHVTIVSTVPTLLTMLDDENLGSLRILILGGEACHRDLVLKWSKNRRMINTYGPTEATVIATATDVAVSDKIVTIGKSIANYSAYIVDPATLRIVPRGVPGELLLGGPGLARGYVKRDDLTASAFIQNPFCRPNSEDPVRLYRTGDLTRWSETGEIEFMGRIDAQIKLRGFRVELAEIESVLLQSELVLSCVCHVMTVSGAQQLVAFLVPNILRSSGGSGDPNAPENLPPLLTMQEEQDLKEKLRVRLPPYMVPSIFETVNVIPTLPSGKANRKHLPMPRVRGSNAAVSVLSVKPNSVEDFGFDDVKKENQNSSGGLEAKILAHVCELFAQATLPVTANFFELGGHSVLVARLVSLLRKDPTTACATMADVYNNPTVESLSAHLVVKNGTANAAKASNAASSKSNGSNQSIRTNDEGASGKETYVPISGLSYHLCWFAQTILLYFVWAVPAFMLLFAYKFFMWRMKEGDPWWGALFLTFPVITLFYPIMLLIAIIMKWVLLGKLQPGRHRLWGWWFLRWWLVKKVTEFVPMYPLYGTVFLNWYFKALGVKIGSNVYIGSTNIFGNDLISIGDDSSINADAQLEAIRVVQGWIILGRISIGKRCYVASRAMIVASQEKDTVINDDGQLGDLSLLQAGGVIPSHQNWSGSPARFACEVPVLSEELLSATRPSFCTSFWLTLAKLFIFELLPWLLLAEVAPLFLVIFFRKNILVWLGNREWLYYLVVPLPVATLSLLSLAISILIVKWIIVRKWTATVISIHSLDYLRKWIYEGLIGTLETFLHPVFSSLYFPPLLRALGAKLGADTEISTATHFTPDLLEIGQGCFIADDVCLGPPVVHLGWMQLGRIQIGDKTFIGNSALIPPNTVAKSNVLVGAMSTGPRKAHAVTLPYEAYPELSVVSATATMRTDQFQYGYEAVSSEGGLVEPLNPEKDSFPIRKARQIDDKSFDSLNVPLCELPDQTNWFGVPAIRLPRRIDWTENFTAADTFAPPWYMLVLRYIIEYFRIVVPLTYLIVEFLLFIYHADDVLRWLPYSNYPNPDSLLNLNLLFWPCIMILSGMTAGFLALFSKWVLMRRYYVSAWPLYSTYVWRSEYVVALCESLADPLLMNSLRGTPWVLFWLRLMGASIGSYTYCDSLQMTEFDLVTIGTECTIGQDVTVQTHLFEDRICKMETVVIGDYCSIGPLSVVLYSSRMEEGSTLSSQSLLMKNESLPAWTQWHGLPAAPYVAPSL